MNAYSRTLPLPGATRVGSELREAGSSALDRRTTWAAPDPATMLFDPWGAPAASCGHPHRARSVARPRRVDAPRHGGTSGARRWRGDQPGRTVPPDRDARSRRSAARRRVRSAGRSDRRTSGVATARPLPTLRSSSGHRLPHRRRIAAVSGTDSPSGWLLPPVRCAQRLLPLSRCSEPSTGLVGRSEVGRESEPCRSSSAMMRS